MLYHIADNIAMFLIEVIEVDELDGNNSLQTVSTIGIIPTHC